MIDGKIVGSVIPDFHDVETEMHRRMLKVAEVGLANRQQRLFLLSRYGEKSGNKVPGVAGSHFDKHQYLIIPGHEVDFASASLPIAADYAVAFSLPQELFGASFPEVADAAG